MTPHALRPAHLRWRVLGRRTGAGGWRCVAAVTLAAVAACLLLASAMAADQPPAAPGAGHGFLIDTHIAAGITCNACHGTAPPQPVGPPTCLRCHGGTYDKLAAMTAADNPNPHQSHQGKVPCVSCHHVHQASENLCAQCHPEFDNKVP